jgi:hypothetical protein
MSNIFLPTWYDMSRANGSSSVNLTVSDGLKAILTRWAEPKALLAGLVDKRKNKVP